LGGALPCWQCVPCGCATVNQMRHRGTGAAFVLLKQRDTTCPMATLTESARRARRGVRRLCEWLREARAHPVFRVHLYAPDHVRRDVGRFSAFSVGGTRVREVRAQSCADALSGSDARCSCDCSATCATGTGSGASGGSGAGGAGGGTGGGSGVRACAAARCVAAGCTDGALAGASGGGCVLLNGSGAAERTCLAVECDNDADRIVHLRRLWAAFPALRDCAFEMTRVTGAWREKCMALF
jgi:hypothetical protein